MTQEATMMTDAATTTESAAASTEADQTAATAAAAGDQQQDTQGATTEGQAADGTKAPADPAKPQGAPEAYADFTVPEGYEFSGELAEDFKAVAKELNLSQEQAQRLIDLDMKRLQSSGDALQQASAEWTESAKSDKEFGGDKLPENISLAKKALDTFGTPELRNLLEETGLGNHPEIIRAFYRAGKAISEDGFIAGGGNPSRKSDARSLYAKSNMNP